MIADWFSAALDWILLCLDSLVRNSRFLLGLIALGIIVFALSMVAPLFYPVNYSQPLPVCGVYITRPLYARITGTNTLTLRANSANTDFSVTEGNYLVTLLEEKDLNPGGSIKKISRDFEVAPSAIWKFPQDNGEIVVSTNKCTFTLFIALDWWSISFRFLAAIASLFPVWAIVKALLEK